MFLGIKAAVKRALCKETLEGLHIAIEGAGSVGTGVALHAANEGARLSIADVDADKPKKLADATGGTVVNAEDILYLEADVVNPNALGAILNEEGIALFNRPIAAGGNDQLAKPVDGVFLKEREIPYAADDVINAGGIINVCTEYLGDGDANLVRERIESIPVRLEQIWTRSAETGRDPAAVADAMAQRLIALGATERERGREGRITALFGLVGAINLPIIHYSVLWWRTLQQGQSIGLSASTIDPSILWPLPLAALGFACLFAAVTLMRMRTEIARARVEARLRRSAVE